MISELLKIFDRGPLAEEEKLLFSLPQPQRTMWTHWKNRLSEENVRLAMLSKQYRSGSVPITDRAAAVNDIKFSVAIDRYMTEEVRDWKREQRQNSSPFPNRLICIGAGNGLGLRHCVDAVNQGMRLEVVDWLYSALAYCKKPLRPIFWPRFPDFWHWTRKSDVLKLGEVKLFCQNLAASTQQSGVAILEMFRLIEHLAWEDAEEALRSAGAILRDPRARICIGDALWCPYNNQVCTQTCNHYTEEFILGNLKLGAGVPVRVCRRSYPTDLEKLFTFITVRRTVDE